MIKKLLLIIIITFSQATIAQSNDVLAKSYFLKVQENYSNGKNDLALKNLNKCLEILGSTNPKIEAMYVRLENDPVKRQNHLKKYFELADEEHSDQIEMIELSASVASRAEKLKAAITTKIAENISRNWEKEGPIQVWNHYYNKNKELAFQHKFIADSPFEDGIAIVFNNSGRKSRALINTKGEIISNIYSYIVKIKNGFYKCRLSSYDYGLLNRTGELISSYYENIIPIKESNLFRVNNKNDEHTLQDEYGIIDQEGKIIAETKYKEFSYFKEGLLALNPRHYYKDENAFYINKEGKKIITMPPESQGNQFNDGIAKVYNPKGSYFINKKGDKISDKVFKTASAFSEGMAFVKLNGQFYTINKHGYLTALPKALSKYEYIGALSGGVAKAVYSYRDNKGNELVTKKGTIIYTPNNIKSISNTIEKGVFIATLNNKNKVLINNKGEIISKEYEVIKGFKYGVALTYNAFNNKRKGDYIIDRNGNELELPESVNKLSYRNGNGTFKAKTITGEYIDFNIQIKKYSDNEEYSEDIAVVQEGPKLGYVDRNNKIIIPLIYDDAWPFKEGGAIVKKDNKYSLIDKKGNYLLKDKDNIWRYENEVTIGYKNDDTYSLFALDGVILDPKKYDYLDQTNISSNFKIIRFKNDGKIGAIDAFESVIIPSKYDNIGFIENNKNLLVFIKSGKWGFFTDGYKEATTRLYDNLNFLTDTLLAYTISNNYGLINTKGKELTNATYSSISKEYVNDNILIVQSGETQGIINTNGEVLLPLKNWKFNYNKYDQSFYFYANYKRKSVEFKYSFDNKIRDVKKGKVYILNQNDELEKSK